MKDKYKMDIKKIASDHFTFVSIGPVEATVGSSFRRKEVVV